MVHRLLTVTSVMLTSQVTEHVRLRVLVDDEVNVPVCLSLVRVPRRHHGQKSHGGHQSQGECAERQHGRIVCYRTARPQLKISLIPALRASSLRSFPGAFRGSQPADLERDNGLGQADRIVDLMRDIDRTKKPALKLTLKGGLSV